MRILMCTAPQRVCTKELENDRYRRSHRMYPQAVMEKMLFRWLNKKVKADRCPPCSYSLGQECLVFLTVCDDEI